MRVPPLVWLLSLGGCAGPAAPAQRPADSLTPAAPADAVAQAGGAPAASEPEAAPAPSGKVRAPEAPFAEGTHFPPAAIPPPHARSSAEGDGAWVPLGSRERGDRIADEPHTVYRTVIHPHPVSKWAKLTLAAIDLGSVRLGYVPGKEDVEELKSVGGLTPPENLLVGLVPPHELASLLVVFNGGFKPRHGRWGLRARGTTLLAARNEGCSVGIDAQGLVTIAPWPKLSERERDLLAFRQTPPCLVSDGELHPELERHNERAWGGFDPKRKTRRRSALGLDESGRVLFYGIGEEMGPRVLALGMRYAGAVNAAQLDINWSWTRFLVFGEVGETGASAGVKVTTTLIPEMVHEPRGYVDKPSARDFFYVLRRRTALAPSSPQTPER